MYVRYVLIYAGPTWAPYLATTNWKGVEVIQNIALCTILTAPWYVSNRTLRDLVGYPTIKGFIKKKMQKICSTETLSKNINIYVNWADP